MVCFVLIEDSVTVRMVTQSVLEERFPGCTVIAPLSWEEAERELSMTPRETIVITGGFLWGERSAQDVYNILDFFEMADRVVLYSTGAGLDTCPDIKGVAMKPDVHALCSIVTSMLKN